MSEVKSGALQSPANTSRTTDTIVRHVQPIGADGEVTPAGTSTSNAQFVQNTNLNPVWAHVLDEQPFTAQAADASSTAVNVLGYADIAFTLTDAICDGTLTVKDEFGATLSFIQNNVVVTSIVCAGAGTNYHHCQITNAKPKQLIFTLASRTTGSITVDLHGL